MNGRSSQNTSSSSRRTFLRGASTAAIGAGLGVGFSAPRVFASERAVGANERPGVGFIGVGGRCQAHINICKRLQQAGRCDTVAVCDVYKPRAEAAAEKTGGKIYRDYRDLLADPRVDVVCIATPDRHHAPQAIDAIRAGKDVYCEKPLTHWTQMELARQIGVEAEKHGTIVQVGTQFVADDAYDEVRKLIKDGVVGKIVHVQAGYFRRSDRGERMPIPDPNAQPGPDLNWEAFLGDAPKRPFDISRFFQWRLYWDYAGGPATDLLVHSFTPVFCMLDLGFPEQVVGGGGRFHYNHAREVTDQCNIIADYAGGPSVVLMSSLSNFTGIKTMLRGTDGIIIFGGVDNPKVMKPHGIRIVPAANGSEEIRIPWQGVGDTGRLWENFFDCVKSRRQPYSPIDIAVRVQAPLNMGIISQREGKTARMDPTTGEIKLS